jgi:hypothetical protein
MAIPRVAISTRSSPLLSLAKWREVCERSRIDAIDLDLTNPVRSHLALRGLGRDFLTNPRIQSVWIGRDCPALVSNLTSRDSMLILPQASLQGGRKSKTIEPKSLDGMRSKFSEKIRFAIALDPINHEGTRTHLDRISAIRHVAEEWDFDIALDLTGPIDHRWEAEAAVLRLGERLKLIRLTPPAFDRARFWQDSTQLRDVTVSRVLSALSDFGFATTLSFKLRTSFWNWSNPVAIADEMSLALAATLAKFQIQSTSITTPPKRVG